jgi:DNA-binding MarR family transcriptional regulator
MSNQAALLADADLTVLEVSRNRCERRRQGTSQVWRGAFAIHSLRSIPRREAKSMAVTPQETDAVETLRGTVIALVRSDRTDLTARQLGVFLTCYLTEVEQTVRGLAKHLNVSKPAITRALDRLAESDLIRRKADTTDRRSVLVGRTPAGSHFLRDMKAIMQKAAASPG